MNTTGRSWVGMMAGGLLLIISLVCLAFLAVLLARDLSIWVLGRHTTAEVVDLWVERTSEEGAAELTFDYYVQYQFEASNGQVVTRTAIMAALEWSGIGIGSPVDVVYFTLYPAHNRLDDSRYIPVLACAYVPLVFLCLAGLMAGRHFLGKDFIRWLKESRFVASHQRSKDDVPR